MAERREWRWTFVGFQSSTEGRPVQTWYDRLPVNHRSEITDLLLYMEKTTDSLWTRPFFDPLEGEGGISEIIVEDIRDSDGVAYYRIYGCFGPGKHEYTFLHPTNKKVRNDRHGKSIAKDRLRQLQRGRGDATVHKFDFKEGPVVEIKKGSGNEN